jgi:hypothetical protein
MVTLPPPLGAGRKFVEKPFFVHLLPNTTVGKEDDAFPAKGVGARKDNSCDLMMSSKWRSEGLKEVTTVKYGLDSKRPFPPFPMNRF